MISHASKLAEHFRYSNRFYYLTIDLQGRFSYVNPAFQEQFNAVSTNFNGSNANNPSVFGHNRLQSFLQHCIRHPYIPVTAQINIKMANDVFKTIQWEFSAIIDENGKTIAVQAIGVKLGEHENEIAVDEHLDKLRYQAAMLENVSDIIISCGLEHKIKTWNRSAELIYNIKAEDAIGKTITELVKVEYVGTTREQAHQEFYQTGSWRGEVIYKNHHGEKKYLLNRLSFLTSESGERIGIMLIGSDITDRKNAEETLRQSESFYKNLIGDSLDGILLTDENACIDFCTVSAKRILGYNSSEVIGKNAFEFVHPDDLPFAVRSFKNEVASAPEVPSIIIRLLAKNREWIWCMVRGHNLLINPYVGKMAIYFSDHTSRKKAEDALRESEERFRRLVSDLKFGVIMRAADGAPILCNKPVLDFLEISEQDFKTLNFPMSVVKFVKENGEDLSPDENPYTIASTTKRPVRDFVLGAYRTNKKKITWMLINSDPILNDDGELLHVITTCIDITERRALEQSLINEKINKQKIINKASVEAQEKERNEIGKELHDNIGQQLTTTKLSLDIVKENLEGAELKLVSQASRAITDIINEIRNLSRALAPSSINDLGLIESVKDLCESIKTTQAFAIRFYHSHFDEGSLDEHIKLMLFRVIQEQINNIIKHAEASAILIRLQMDAEQLILSIVDNGRGFDPASINKGLGIDNMINRAEILNGKLDIKSELGKGCSVIVSIPLNRD